MRNRCVRAAAAAWVGAAVVAAGALAAGGCISVDVGGKKGERALDRYHVLDAADLGPAAGGTGGAGGALALPGLPTGAGGSRPVIAVRPFRARDRYDRQVLRRDGAGRITPLEFELWADDPAQAVTDVAREALAASGAFAAAVDPGDAHETDVLLDGTILEFTVSLPAAAADGSSSSAAASPGSARFAARLTLADPRSGRILVTGAYAGESPLSGPGTDGLGPAMGRAVGQALRALLADAARSSTVLK